MFSFLKNHPFAVEAFFESSLVLTFAFPKDDLNRLIPECLELDLLNNELGFVAVALVQTKDLRPKGFPAILGNDFFLIGYRIFVRYQTKNGKNLRGLYILKSETDKKKMSFYGNIFTHYNYSTTDVTVNSNNEHLIIHSDKSELSIEVNLKKEAPALPVNSPFADWKEARRFAGPLPFTFSYNQSKGVVTIIEGVRENWTPAPVEVLKYDVGFLKGDRFKNAILANAFIVENIPYYWRRGKTELWAKR